MEWLQSLRDHAETPPEGVWEAVRAEVEDFPLQLSARLRDHAEPPPAAVFESVQAALSAPLEEKEQARVRRMPSFRRYLVRTAGAAAAIAAALWFAASYPGGGDRASDSLPGSAVASASDAAVAGGRDAGAGAGKASILKNAQASLRKTTLPLTKRRGDGTALADSHPEEPSFTSVRYMDRRYLSVTDAKGRRHRVSHRLSRMVRTIAEAPSTPQMREEAAYWEQRLDGWRNRMAEAGYVPMAGDVHELMALVEVLGRE